MRQRSENTPGFLVLKLILMLVLLPALVLSSSCVPARTVDVNDPLTAAVFQGLESGPDTFSHTVFDGLLKKHVKPSGRVDYAGLKKDHDKLKVYLDQLAAAEVATLKRDELLAFFINAYNAYTLDLIVREYPVASIKDLSDPWDSDFCRVGGQIVTLNDIEHRILRPKELFDDPRMHFAINCASIGCPYLRAEAYTGARVDEQLDDSVRKCLTDAKYVAKDGDSILVSKILSWFKGDFTEKHGTLTAFLTPYVNDDVKTILEAEGDGAIGYLDYDWNLNDTSTTKP